MTSEQIVSESWNGIKWNGCGCNECGNGIMIWIIITSIIMIMIMIMTIMIMINWVDLRQSYDRENTTKLLHQKQDSSKWFSVFLIPLHLSLRIQSHNHWAYNFVSRFFDHVFFDPELWRTIFSVAYLKPTMFFVQQSLRLIIIIQNFLSSTYFSVPKYEVSRNLVINLNLS